MGNISNLVRDQRNKLGLTMEEVAKKAELSQGFLSKLENDGYEPANLSLDTIIRLANALNLKVKDFLDNLKIIDSEQSPALNVYLRTKFDIKNKADVEMIEMLINRLKHEKQ